SIPETSTPVPSTPNISIPGESITEAPITSTEPISEKIDVIFYMEGLKYKTLSVESNTCVSKPEDPEKIGYTFEGWYADVDFLVLYDFTSPVTEELSLYAKFEISKYTIEFVNTTIGSIKVEYNEKVTQPEDPKKTGYTFKGWYIDAEFTTEYNFNTAVVNDLKLYAKFEINKPTVYFISEGSIYKSVVVNYDTTVDEPVDPSKAGYSFKGWYTDSTYTEQYSFTNKVTSDLYLYAKFEKLNASTIEINITSSGGYNEGAYVEFDVIPSLINASDYTISYKLSSNLSYISIDTELIRLNSTTVRADLVGLVKGTYSILIECEIDNEKISKEISNVEVGEADRSGYAHFVAKDNEIGAYNDDGSLKSNAVVIYVTNETKNTVTYNGKTGIVSILKNISSVTKPVVVRFIGRITTNQYIVKDDEPRLADNSNYTTDAENKAFLTNNLETTYGENLVGLVCNVSDKKGKKTYKYTTTKTGLTLSSTGSTSAKTTTYKGDKYPSLYGKTVYDDDSYFNMLDIASSTLGLTIEGIGTDAEIFQWGFTFSKCCNVEVRNLTFTDGPEDSCSFEGNASSPQSYTGFWIHNNVFNRGINNWDISGERDKYAGDGAMDLKGICGVTASYNVFNNCKKTGLVGGSDTDVQYDITFHHNYYNNVESRLPLGRQANMHFYNNYYNFTDSKKTSVTIDLRANAFGFSEYNYFDGYSGKPRCTVVSDNSYYPAVKSYNDYYGANTKAPTSSYQAATIVSDRTAAVSNGCKINSVDYSSFDTNSSLFYYDSINKKSNVSILTPVAEVPEFVKNNAGILKGNFTSEDTDNGNNSGDSGSSNTWTTVLSNDFSTAQTITEVATAPSSPGLYYMYTDGGTATDNNISIKNNSLYIYDNSSAASTYGYYMFDNSYNSGKVRISLDFTPETVNSKWSMISFIDGANNLQVRTDANKFLGYSVDGGTTTIAMFDSAYTASTTYTIVLTVDFDNNTASISINGTTAAIDGFKSKEFKGLMFQTAISALRSFTIDNILIETA
ncbi:MAG: InlB B-repeat-containing protein, partial [Anaeroplasma sp.]